MSAGAQDALDPTNLLEVSELKVHFLGDRGVVTEAVAGTSFTLKRGTTLGIVGESGSGKSVTALAIMRLLDAANARVSGRIVFEGHDLLSLPESAVRDLRGNRMGMVFQEPMTSLNPSYTIGDQIGEALRRHQGQSADEARQSSIALLRQVRIPSPEQRVDEYPHKLSGGMRQRAMIAMALACQPALLIADEPTTALDVTIQAQILDLMRDLRRSTGTAILLITHDLGVVAEMCEEVIVMYAGEIVERATVEKLFSAPEHPYTVGLMGAIPRLSRKRALLATIPGMVPVLSGTFTGCRFAARCPFADDKCRAQAPPLHDTGDGHLSRCWKIPLQRLAEELPMARVEPAPGT
jgi:peptide/nickel transport system ATP-binding protein